MAINRRMMMIFERIMRHMNFGWYRGARNDKNLLCLKNDGMNRFYEILFILAYVIADF